MDKAGLRIVPHAAELETQRDFPQLPHINRRYLKVHGLPGEMIAVFGDAMTSLNQSLVVLGRAIAGDNMNVIVSAELAVHGAEILDHPHVHDCRLVGFMATEEPVEVLKGLPVIGTGGIAVRHSEPFLGMKMIERQPPLKERRRP